MAILEVSNVKKIYTTRFGGNQVEALKNVSFQRGTRRICGDHGRVRFRKDDPSQYPGGAGPAHSGEVRLNGQRMARYPGKRTGGLSPEKSGFCVPGL